MCRYLYTTNEHNRKQNKKGLVSGEGLDKKTYIVSGHRALRSRHHGTNRFLKTNHLNNNLIQIQKTKQNNNSRNQLFDR